MFFFLVISAGFFCNATLAMLLPKKLAITRNLLVNKHDYWRNNKNFKSFCSQSKDNKLLPVVVPPHNRLTSFNIVFEEDYEIVKWARDYAIQFWKKEAEQQSKIHEAIKNSCKRRGNNWWQTYNFATEQHFDDLVYTWALDALRLGRKQKNLNLDSLTENENNAVHMIYKGKNPWEQWGFESERQFYDSLGDSIASEQLPENWVKERLKIIQSPELLIHEKLERRALRKFYNDRLFKEISEFIEKAPFKEVCCTKLAQDILKIKPD